MTIPPSRPDPDQLLAHAQAEENAARRGHLKIFLGYAAGVGKTFAMLEAAHMRHAEGKDVVVGYVETHGRSETEALIHGLEVIHRRPVEYHGITLTEMDVDGLLARRPTLALVDELAHTNAPGSRHPKRYQDVIELLEAGIDVYTTLNIQHLESLNDVVAQITGVLVRETIPDKVMDQASELELVDLPPDELLVRLREGKVYVPEQASRAIEKFFRKGNLTALREMAMRRAAERVDDQMRAYMQARSIHRVWAASERILVCVSPGTLGERLVRTARRLADELNAEWLCLYVETPANLTLPQEKRDQITRTLRMAEELGAHTHVIPGRAMVPDIARAITDFARKHNITKIVAGKPLRPRWFDLIRGSLVDELIYRSGEMDIYVVTSVEPARIPPEENPLNRHSTWPNYLWSTGLVSLATIIGHFISRTISPTNLVMLYLLVVVVAAVFLGRGPAMLASFLGVLAFDFFFVPPFFTLAVSDTEYIITFIGLFIVGVVISALTVSAREQAEAAQQREADTAALYALSRDLASAEGVDAVVQAVRAHVEPDFGREVVIYLPDKDEDGTDSIRPYWQTVAGVNPPSESEASVAIWAFRHGEAAGLGTNTLPSAEPLFTPLKTSRGVVGVLSLNPLDPTHPLTTDQRRLLEGFTNQVAQAIERIRLAEQTRQIELLKAAEKLQNAMLNSISHDLRTPLVSITGALTTLEQQGGFLASEATQSLIETAREEADRLNQIVGNLLDMTRLEAGALKVKSEPSDIQDLIGAAIGQIEERLSDRELGIDIPSDFPLVRLDFVLIVHVLHNLLDNSLKYSPAGSPLEIQVRLVGAEAQISILDRGLGVPAGDLDRIFDKFYRAERTEHINGTGLGLAICKGIIEAHGGRIWAANREGGGMEITLALPVTDA